MADLSRRAFLGLSGASLSGALISSCSDDSILQHEQGSHCHVVGGEVLEPARSLPVMAQTEVLVLGGGPAGLSAALSAAKEGVKTMLVERYGFFGGVITQTMMASLAWYRFAKTVDAGGVRLEMEQRAKEMGATLDVIGYSKNPLYVAYMEKHGLMVKGEPTFELLETELFKHVVDTMLAERGVTCLLHCSAVDAIMDGDRIRGVVTESKSGRQAILAKRVIDATGDADIAARAGAPYRQNSPGELMEATVNFGMTGINLQRFFTYMVTKGGSISDFAETTEKESELISPHLKEPFEKAKKAGEIPQDAHLIAYPGSFTDAGEIPNLNAVHLFDIDPTDVWDLTRAEIEGRALVVSAAAALKKYTPGFKGARLRTIGHAIGVRESRSIEGEYNLTEEEVLGEARFKESIGICPEFLDGHGLMILPTTGRYFHVPYGILVPREVENLLVVGRAVAGDRMSHTATRQMVCCCVTGQGAGVAAAASIEQDTTCRSVDIGDVQTRLEAQGVRLI